MDVGASHIANPDPLLGFNNQHEDVRASISVYNF